MTAGEGTRRTATVSVLFCDLAGSTERQVRLGDDVTDGFRRRFFGALREVVAHTHGEEVKNTGDGLMVVFRHSALDAVACAVGMHEAVAAIDPDDPVQIYVGISAGEAAEDDTDWFGTPVNEAARLCAAAKPGQTLTNELVRGLVGNRGSFAFRSVGAMTLKGLPTPVATVEVVTPSDTEPVAEHPRRAGGHKLLIAAAIILIVVAVIAGVLAFAGNDTAKNAPAANVSAPKHDYPVSYSSTSCPHDAPTVTGLTCGTLTVPEDRTKPHGRVVKLTVYRAAARGPATGDPVVDFGADNLVTSPARDHAEEIQLAQRGGGNDLASDPSLTCPEYAKIAPDALTKPSGDRGQQTRDTRALRACYDRWTAAGVDLNTYNYVTAGDDMADLIRKLNFAHVNIVSGYIATIMALEVVRELPGVVRTLTLQEPVAPGQSGFTNPIKYLSDAFHNYVALCQADKVCNTAFPDLPGALRRIYDLYRTAPTIVVGKDQDGNKHPVLLDGDRTAIALANALSHSETYPLIAAVIATPKRDSVIDSVIADRVVTETATHPDAPWGGTFSGWCSYEVHTVDDVGSEISRRTIPELAGVVGQPLADVCKSWPVHKVDDVAFDDPSTTVPTLIVTPILQPGNDPQWADTFRRGLPNATVLKFATLDGGVLVKSDPACLATIRRAFLADPTKPIDGAACERQSPPIHFLASLGG